MKRKREAELWGLTDAVLGVLSSTRKLSERLETSPLTSPVLAMKAGCRQ